MGQSCTSGSEIGADSSQIGGDGGADVFAQNQHYTGLKRDDAARRESEGDPQGSRAALNDDRQHRPDKHTQQIVVPYQKEHVAEFDAGLDGLKSFFHGGQTEKEDAEAKENLAGINPLPVSRKKLKSRSGTNGRQGIGSNFESDQLSGDGGADIGTENNADGLIKRHQTCVDKSHHHDGSGTRGLDDSRNGKPHQGADKTVRGQGGKNFPHFVAGHLLQPLGHDFHAEEKETQPPKQTKNQCLVKQNIQHQKLSCKDLGNTIRKKRADYT